MFTPLETWSLVKRRLALGGSYGSCRVTGNCRPATDKTQQQVDVCHLRQPESGQVRTRGRTCLDRFLVVMFPCLACSHRHFDFDSLCSHVPDPAPEPRSPARAVEVLIPPVAAWCSTNLSPSLLHCLSLSNTIVCCCLSQVSHQEEV